MKNAASLFMIFLFLCPHPSFADQDIVIQWAKKRITLTGYTRSKTTATVSSEVSGKLIRVNYDVAQVIGEKPFFEIDSTFVNFQIESTRHSLKKLKVARQKMSSQAAYLKKEFSRIDQLHKGDRATEVRRDAAEEELKQARFETKSLDIEKAVLDTTLKELQERKGRHHIYASKGWIVVKKRVEAGEIVAQSMPLAEVGDYGNLVVPLAVSGDELSAIRRLPEEFDAQLEGEPVKASINWVNPEFNEQTRKLSIEVALAGYEGEKRGGLRFSMPIEIKTEGLFVPKAAVTNRYDNPRVTLKETGKTINVMVLGETDDGLIIAEDAGLAPGVALKRMKNEG